MRPCLLALLVLTMATAAWSQEKTPLSLDQAVATALAQNPDVRAARAQVRAADAGLARARAGRLPAAGVEANWTRTLRVPVIAIPGFAFPHDSYYVTGSLTQMLYTGGLVGGRIREARGGAESSQYGYALTEEQLVFLTKQAYYNVLAAAEGVAVAQDALASAREHLRIAQARFDVGRAPRFDVLQAEARTARTEQDQIRAQNAFDVAWASLNKLMSRPLDERAELVPVSLPPRPTESLEALTQTALTARPEIGQLQAAKVSARGSIDVARSGLLPSIGVAASYSQRTEAALGLSGGTLMAFASMSLYDGGASQAGIRQGKATLQQAEEQEDSLRQAIALQVRTAHLNVTAAGPEVAAAEKEVAPATEAHRIAVLRYEEGVGTSVEILDAEAGRTDAQNRLAQARLGYNLAVAALDLALGRRWSPPPPAAPLAPTAPAK